MALQGPLVVISETPVEKLVARLGEAGAFPIVEARWVEAVTAVTSVQPSAIVIASADHVDRTIAEEFARRVLSAEPYVPVVALMPRDAPLPYPAALPLAAEWPNERLVARLAAAMRVRELHAMVLRRLKPHAESPAAASTLAQNDPLDDASVLVLGRGRSYPTLSVAMGERVGVIGALSIEAAGRRLAAREINGLVIGDGFSPKIIDAFLVVLAEDGRFRDLPIAALGDGCCPEQMPNILRECDPIRLVERILPLVRQHAFNARLERMLKTLDTNGMLDPVTGLLHENAFAHDLVRAVEEASEQGCGLSIARFSFDDALDRRTSFDVARVVARLMRKVDFACRQDDGSILAVFTGTDLRAAHVVARRLASLLKEAMLSGARDRPIVPSITLATLKPHDTALTLMARVTPRTVAAE
ncbi:MAG TPA: GGDEF domain-containing protein [Xanthobacteraceae bacterium]|nr:GGDEF domain-containing protein [Xanthobacteraceae bacterium]